MTCKFFLKDRHLSWKRVQRCSGVNNVVQKPHLANGQNKAQRAAMPGPECPVPSCTFLPPIKAKSPDWGTRLSRSFLPLTTSLSLRYRRCQVKRYILPLAFLLFFYKAGILLSSKLPKPCSYSGFLSIDSIQSFQIIPFKNQILVIITLGPGYTVFTPVRIKAPVEIRVSLVPS